MKDWLRNIFKDKKGMGTVEVILIVVLVGLVIIFKGKITGVVNDIFEKIVSQTSRISEKRIDHCVADT